MQAATASAPRRIWAHPLFLRRVLLADAATCVTAGLLMSMGAGVIAPLTALPPTLLLFAGLALFFVALVMAAVALREPLSIPGAWLVIVGNVGWVAGSLALMALLPLTALGMAFVFAQALAVAALTTLEIVGVRRL